jgi:nucleoside-diphosphate-sugar epimerase
MTRKIILLDSTSVEARILSAALADHAVQGAALELTQPGLPSSLELDGAVVINCFNRTRGDAAALLHANRDLPASWAQDAKARGAAQFIQLSSFSVFGDAARIDEAAQLRPASDYGRSKLAAEQTLAALASDSFAMTILRIPAVVGAGNDRRGDKLAKLIRLAKRTGFFPASKTPCPRAMLSADGLGAVIRMLVDNPRTAVLQAADPEHFTAALLAQQASAQGLRIRPLILPGPLLALIARAAPPVHRSLFMPVALADEANCARNAPPFEALRDVISRLLASS